MFEFLSLHQPLPGIDGESEAVNSIAGPWHGGRVARTGLVSLPSRYKGWGLTPGTTERPKSASGRSETCPYLAASQVGRSRTAPLLINYTRFMFLLAPSNVVSIFKRDRAADGQGQARAALPRRAPRPRTRAEGWAAPARGEAGECLSTSMPHSPDSSS